MALLIVDMQAGLFAQAPPAHDLDAVFERINQLARRARAVGAPVFLIQHEAAGTELAHASPGWQLDARLATEASDVRVRKRSSAPYASSQLHAMLAKRGIGAVAVAGYASEFCIDSTVRWSASLGYLVTLVSDAHTTHDKPHLDAASIIAHHNATLPAIHSLGAPIVAAAAATLWRAEPAPAGARAMASAQATGGASTTLLDDLVTAFEWVSADMGGHHAAFVCRRTGQVYWQGGPGELDDDDELPQDLDDDTRYAVVPNKHDLDLGNRLAMRFVEEFVPQRRTTVAGYFHRPGAYRNLKALLEREGQLENWNAYEEAAVHEALRDWAAEQQLPLQTPTP
jgi:nicotinamidase-related amidase